MARYKRYRQSSQRSNRIPKKLHNIVGPKIFVVKALLTNHFTFNCILNFNTLILLLLCTEQVSLFSKNLLDLTPRFALQLNTIDS